MSWEPDFIWEPTDSGKLKLEAFEFLVNLTTEEFLMHPKIFGLETASPLQRAICRVADGLPIGDLWDDPNVRDSFGNVQPNAVIPRELNVIAGIRGGKTLLAAAVTTRRSLIVNLEGLRDGEVARSGICSPDTNLSTQCFEYMSHVFQESELLREVTLKIPPQRRGGNHAPSIRVYNPVYHKAVDILILAAKRGGSAGVSRWQCAFVVDEAARMLGDASEGVANYADVRGAVIERIRPGGIFMALTSPWAPTGIIYENSKRVGKPTEALVVVHAPARRMNPEFWTEEEVERRRRLALESGSDNVFMTDVEGKFVTQDTQFFNLDDLDRAMAGRIAPSKEFPFGPDLPFVHGARYVVFIDAAGRKNTFTMSIATSVLGRRVVVAYREWTGTTQQPLDLDDVFRQVCELALKYEQPCIFSDHFSVDANNALARRYGCWLEGIHLSAQERTQRATTVLNLARQGNLSIPAIPVVREDFLSARRKQTRTGPTIEFPLRGARHGDGAVSIIGAVSQLGEVTYTPPHELSPEEVQKQQEREWFLKGVGKERAESFLSSYDDAVDSTLEYMDNALEEAALVEEALKPNRW